MIWRWLKRLKREMEMPPSCICGYGTNPNCPVIAWMEERAREDLPVARLLK